MLRGALVPRSPRPSVRAPGFGDAARASDRVASTDLLTRVGIPAARARGPRWSRGQARGAPSGARGPLPPALAPNFDTTPTAARRMRLRDANRLPSQQPPITGHPPDPAQEYL